MGIEEAYWVEECTPPPPRPKLQVHLEAQMVTLCERVFAEEVS